MSSKSSRHARKAPRLEAKVTNSGRSNTQVAGDVAVWRCGVRGNRNFIRTKESTVQLLGSMLLHSTWKSYVHYAFQHRILWLGNLCSNPLITSLTPLNGGHAYVIYQQLALATNTLVWFPFTGPQKLLTTQGPTTSEPAASPRYPSKSVRARSVPAASWPSRSPCRPFHPPTKLKWNLTGGGPGKTIFLLKGPCPCQAPGEKGGRVSHLSQPNPKMGKPCTELEGPKFKAASRLLWLPFHERRPQCQNTNVQGTCSTVATALCTGQSKPPKSFNIGLPIAANQRNDLSRGEERSSYEAGKNKT